MSTTCFGGRGGQTPAKERFDGTCCIQVVARPQPRKGLKQHFPPLALDWRCIRRRSVFSMLVGYVGRAVADCWETRGKMCSFLGKVTTQETRRVKTFPVKLYQ